MFNTSTPVSRFVYASTFVLTVAALTYASVTLSSHFGEWGEPVNAETIPGTSSEFNTPFNDGCPIQSPDGLSFYIASNRPGTLGGQDIWVSLRDTKDDPWGPFENLGAPVNSAANDFCPSPTRGHRFFFVSERSGGCGSADIYVTRLTHQGWTVPQNLGCEINSAAGEASPSYFEDENGSAILYFSSNRAGGFATDVGAPDSDIYYSVDFGPALLVPGLNTDSDDSRPNVRHDGREIVFDSTRAGTLGGPDIWTAVRGDNLDGWSFPIHLATPINSSANETRASLSWDGRQLVFGSNRAGSEPGPNNGPPSTDVYISTREKLMGGKN